MRVCFATNNQHKLHEVQILLGDRFRLVTLREIGCNEELREDQDTLEGNSLQKADYVFRKFGVSTFADDSGLTVDALNGAPGVNSAHYAGPQRKFDENMALLLKNLEGESNRKAQFRTIITWVAPATIRQFEGVIHGTILHGKKGTGGFGYDPLFVPDGYAKTFAEMSDGEKNKISHRSIAVKKLIDFLNA